MKKLIISFVVLSVVAFIIVTAVMPNTPAASKKLAAEIKTASADGKNVFIQLSSTGCVTCRKMKPELEKLMADFANNQNIFIVNVDVDAHPSIATQFAVNAVPTQVLLSTGSEEIYRNTGYLSFDSMKSLLNEALN
ncbi:MAG: hypothetical protein C0602_12095 [Denitrovibrio sp.]|nr:MAG: hypothetical protein C0602_12095 [Denitrovibrio sp.]